MMEPPLPVDERARLASLYGMAILGSEREERFDRLARIAGYALDCPMATLGFIDKDREWFKASQGWSAVEVPRRESLGAHAIVGTGAFVIENLANDARFSDHPLAQAGIRFYAGVPLRGPGGGHVGVLAVMDGKARKWSSRDEIALTDLARVAEGQLSGGAGGDSKALTALVHLVHEPVLLVGPSGRILATSPQVESLTAVGALVAPEDREGSDWLARLRGADGLHAAACHAWAKRMTDVLNGSREGAQQAAEEDGIELRALALVVGGRRHAWVALNQTAEAGVAQNMKDRLVRTGLELESERAKARDRRRIGSALANELNTPITPIRLQLHLLLAGKYGKLTPAQKKAVDSIARNTGRWVDLTQGLLALVHGAPLAGRTEDVDVAGLAATGVADRRSMSLKAGIRLHSHVPEEPLLVQCDPEAIRHVMELYLDHALDATPAGGTIEVSVAAEKGEAVVRVRDGNGMSPDKASRIFEPEAALEEDSEVPGLGLAHCRTVVEHQGGRTWAQSDGAGTGLSLYLALPLRVHEERRPDAGRPALRPPLHRKQGSAPQEKTNPTRL
jgi:signal transduction histidine kinase